MSKPIILSMKNVSVHFPVKGALPFSKKRVVSAVSDVSVDIFQGETFGIVGESGCGKSTLANAMIGLVRPTSGEVLFKGNKLYSLSPQEFKEIRRDMQMIFQDPFSSLNPRFNVYQIISEPMKIRGGASVDEMKKRVIELLELVGLSEKDLYRYPSDFSGGQRQRIGIARAIILNPDFLVCDEPVSALDVSVHAQILNLLMELQEKLKMTYVFISHNLAVVKSICDHMVVMYLGNVMESGSTKAIYQHPLHPYTNALLSAVLDVDLDNKKERILLQGDIPSPINPPRGCRFYQRCPYAMKGCVDKKPALIEIEPEHFVACHYINPFAQEEINAGLAKPLNL
ncbi:MAG: oligopeptide/dipeptide ABC transporter ATP-binding protein [Candidatus Izemoplasmatales bacterium]|jgi:oligopeptide transport system ATP-binding protein|nr:ATP-binding cassette domain-containing protein [bacterium]MDZ4197559.1 oligopeptide/dipeptide ABC transporter ATP-binding protein [Candidatus Izemoplasmatales bacterium]